MAKDEDQKPDEQAPAIKPLGDGVVEQGGEVYGDK